MEVATPRVEVGVRELKNRLSHYLGRAQGGDEVIVTARGRPIARLAAIDASDDRLAMLIAEGVVRPPARRQRHRRPAERVRASGSVSDLVAEQRR
jgi:prevent-host-death family protein